LDEADLLSDQIAILSRGALKAQGSAVELKHRLGGGYRVHFFKTPGNDTVLPSFNGIVTKEMVDQTVFTLPDSGQAADFVRSLEAHSIKNYEISSPTIEEIFFNVAEDMEALATPQPSSQGATHTSKSDEVVAVTEDKKSSLVCTSSGVSSYLSLCIEL